MRTLGAFKLRDNYSITSHPIETMGIQEKPHRQNNKTMGQLFEYLKDNQDRELRQKTIAAETGLPPGSIGSAMTRLIDRGAVSRRGKRGHHHYVVHRQRINGVKRKTPTTKVESEPKSKKNEQTLHQMLQSLIIEFVVETKETDVAKFSTWVQKKLN